MCKQVQREISRRSVKCNLFSFNCFHVNISDTQFHINKHTNIHTRRVTTVPQQEQLTFLGSLPSGWFSFHWRLLYHCRFHLDRLWGWKGDKFTLFKLKWHNFRVDKNCSVTFNNFSFCEYGEYNSLLSTWTHPYSHPSRPLWVQLW